MPGRAMIDPTLGRYETLEKVGEGGTGEVNRAENTTRERQAALKVLPPDRRGSGGLSLLRLLRTKGLRSAPRSSP